MSNSERVITRCYDPDFHCLYLADVSPIDVRGEYTNGMTLTEQQAVGFVIKIGEYGRCIGFECFDAAELLLPNLLLEKYEKADFRTNLVVEYCADTDTITLGNGKQAVYSETVTDDWTTHFNDDMDPYENWNVGEIVGLFLGRVSQEVLRLPLQYAPSDYDPSKRERRSRMNAGNLRF